MVFPFLYWLEAQTCQVVVEYFCLSNKEDGVLLNLDVDESQLGMNSIEMKFNFLERHSGRRLLALKAKPSLCRSIFRIDNPLILPVIESILGRDHLFQRLSLDHDWMLRTPNNITNNILHGQGDYTVPLIRSKRLNLKKEIEGERSIIKLKEEMPENLSKCVPLVRDQMHKVHNTTAKKRLKVRSCKNKNSRTAFKRIDLRKISASAFRKVFRAYSLLGGRLKSGSVITHTNSSHWLKDAGLSSDADTLRFADRLFKDFAGCKIVLNIFDYIKFLNIFCREKNFVLAELLQQLTAL